MNKKIIALAVAAALPMAAAQAAPTVYGIGQVEIVSVDDGTDKERGMVDQGTGRIGVKGSEDLGNGLSAVYNFEWGTDTADNQDVGGTDVPTSTTASVSVPGQVFSSRTSIIGFKGSYGEVTFGRQTSPYGRTNLDSFNASALEARGTSAQIASTAFGNGSFVSNSVNYANKFGNVMFRAMITAPDTTGNADSAFSLDFASGPLRIVAALSTDESSAGVDTDRTKVGVQYKVAGFKLTGQVENEETGPADTDYTMVMAEYTMGKNTIAARFGNKDTGSVDTDHSMIAVKHQMSKNTKVWAGLASDEKSATTETDIVSVGMQVKF